MKQNKHKFSFKINLPTHKQSEKTLGIIKSSSYNGNLLFLNGISLSLAATGNINRRLGSIVLKTSLPALSIRAVEEPLILIDAHCISLSH